MSRYNYGVFLYHVIWDFSYVLLEKNFIFIYHGLTFLVLNIMLLVV